MKKVKHHHSNSRRFKCACGTVHEWGHYADWTPRHYVKCACGRHHHRG